MNKDQARGSAKEIAGEVEQKVGKVTGDTDTRLRGHAREMEGKLQRGVGNVKDALDIDERDRELRREPGRDLKR